MALSLHIANLAASSNSATWVFRTSSRTSGLNPCTKRSNLSPSDISLIIRMQLRSSAKYLEKAFVCFNLRSLSRALLVWSAGINSLSTRIQKSSHDVGVSPYCTIIYHHEEAVPFISEDANVIRLSSVISTLGFARAESDKYCGILNIHVPTVRKALFLSNGPGFLGFRLIDPRLDSAKSEKRC